MKISDNGIKLITSFEGCRLSAYQDPVGMWTIGYGHTGGVRPGMTIDKDTAITLFKKDLQRFENNVNKYMSTYHWTQNQFDALVSYAYNIGSIDKLVDYGKRTIQEISNDIPNHNKAGGKVLAGSTRRRAAEKELFDKDVIRAEVEQPRKEIKYYPPYNKSFTSITMALKSIGVNPSKENRKKIAEINGMLNYTGTYHENVKMLSLLKQGKLIAFK